MIKLKYSILVFFFLAFVIPNYAQTVEDDFEGNGTISLWFGDDCGMDNVFTNPFAGGINTSSTVLKYTDTGGPYANVGFDVWAKYDLSENHTFTLKVYVPSSEITGSQTNQISLKLQDGNLPEPWLTQCEIIKTITLDQWQEVTFDFQNDSYINLDPNSPEPTTRNDFSRVLIQINGENNTDQVTAYLDDVSYDGTIEINSNTVVFDHLVWSDEFDDNGAVDGTKWFHQTLLPNGTSWFNNEIQHYTDRIDNSFVEDGNLTILARKETFTDQGQTKEYTSARLNSKFAFTYGRVEVRAKLPIGVGTWPAIWALGKNIDEAGGFWTNEFGDTGWPACGEIDIMEHWGTNQNYVQSALHTPSSSGATVNLGGTMAQDVANTYHVFAMDWYEDKMDFSLDGFVYYTYNPEVKNDATWPYYEDQYLLLNVAIQNSIASNFSESPMVIDYVRVYQESDSTLGIDSPNEKVNIYPNPVQDNLNFKISDDFIGSQGAIYSINGQQMDTFKITSSEMHIDFHTFSSGTYFLRFENGNKYFSYKVIKL